MFCSSCGAPVIGFEAAPPATVPAASVAADPIASPPAGPTPAAPIPAVSSPAPPTPAVAPYQATAVPAPSVIPQGNLLPPPPSFTVALPPSAYGRAKPITNGMAVASLVLGIIWLGGVGSVLALIFGFVGKRRIDKSRGRQGGRGLAIAGIVLGLVGVIGATLLWVGIAASRERCEHSGASVLHLLQRRPRLWREPFLIER